MKVHFRCFLFLLICFIMVSSASCIERIKEERFSATGSASEIDKIEHSALESPAPVIDSIEFYPTEGYLHPDSGNNPAWWSEISFFGTVKGDFTNSENDKILNQLKKFFQIQSVVTEQNQELFVSSADWLVSGDDKESREIQLKVIFKEKIQKKTIVTGIRMEENGILTESPVGKYDIQPVPYAETKNCFMFENIIDLLDTASEDMTLTYRVAVPSKHPDTITFHAVISEDPNRISAEAISWKYDEEATKDAKDYYSTTKTASDIESFQIYAVDVQIKTNLKSAAIQPYITVSYNGNSYHCMSEAVYFDLNRSVQP